MNNRSFRADLHCHTDYSDGVDSPETVLRAAIDKELSGLSITDHDTVSAYPVALPLAKELNFPLLPGIELSSAFREESIHILGYGFSPDSEVIRNFCHRHQIRRTARNRAILAKLKELGIVITEEELNAVSGNSVGRPHIANLMIERRVVSTVKEAFKKYLAEGKSAYVPGNRMTVEETIECIHQAGGLAVLAHPQLIKRTSVIRDLLGFPFDGVEAYYARLYPAQEQKWVEIAEKRGWIITGGSDYHGTNKPLNKLGSSWVGEETFQHLYDHYLKTVKSS
ncbi:MAG: 5'-3' exoribonuclease [Chlamydiae bacterium]|nr:5'-3' exoribonuclease [Chlamydiota bacterium]